MPQSYDPFAPWSPRKSPYTLAQHEAFAAAIEQLYREWPLCDDLERESARSNFLHRAVLGIFAANPDWIPIGLLGVPSDQLFAVHTLVYG